MTYFKYFPQVFYKFGDETTDATFENLSIYADIIDQVSDATTVYQEYYIQPGERPDQVSQKLYNTPEFHWTFYLMNDNIREGGWPQAPNKIFDQATTTYGSRVITTRTKLTDKFKVGQTITGASSGATATIDRRLLDLGQLFLKDVTGTFTASENVNSVNAAGATEVITVQSFEFQYNAAHHYENADGSYADIDPEVGPGGLLTEVTWLDRIQKVNTANREIKVLKAGVVNDIVKAFRDAVGSAS